MRSQISKLIVTSLLIALCSGGQLLFSQIQYGNVTIGNNLPANWSDSLKNKKWQLVNNITIDKQKIVDSVKQNGERSFYFHDSTIVILPYAIQFIKPKKEDVTNLSIKFFPVENTFVTRYYYYNPRTGYRIPYLFLYRVVFLNADFLVLESIFDPYADYVTGKILSPSEIKKRGEEMDREAAANPFSFSTGGTPVYIERPPWDDKFRTLQIFKIIR